MKHTISCDEVFDILTRAPFPTGDESDDDVELHLAGCHECRRLAEALRPALELFHESVSPEEVNNLPGYFGQLSPRVEVSPPTSRRREDRLESASDRRHRAVWRFLAGAVLGAFGGLLLWCLTVAKDNRGTPADRMMANRDAASDRAGLIEFLRRVEAPQACFPTEFTTADSAPATASLNLAMHCCTCCHASGKVAHGRTRLIKLAPACGICHKEISTSTQVLNGA